SPVPSGFIRRIAAVIAGGAQMCTRRPNRRVQHVVRSERDELPRVALIRVRKLVVDGDRRRRRVEVLLDIVEAEDLTGGRHIQRAVAYRDAVRLTEPRG